MSIQEIMKVWKSERKQCVSSSVWMSGHRMMGDGSLYPVGWVEYGISTLGRYVNNGHCQLFRIEPGAGLEFPYYAGHYHWWYNRLILIMFVVEQWVGQDGDGAELTAVAGAGQNRISVCQQ